jgi:hypothetical protein
MNSSNMLSIDNAEAAQSTETGLSFAPNFIAVDTIVIPEAAETFFTCSLLSMFTHSNPEAVISLDLHSVNGSSLPEWMSFDPVRKVISGTPPKEATGEYQLELVAKDQFGGEARTTVLIKVG